MTCNVLRGYALTEEGREIEGEEQRLPVVSDCVMQHGQTPSGR
jgi:hypothetical protein